MARLSGAPAPLPSASSVPPPAPGSRVTGREIWNLTWPQFLLTLLQFLVGITDVVVAGEIDSGVQAALGFITRCQFFLLVFGLALVNGGVAAMSQALGAKLSLRAERYSGLLFKVTGLTCLIVLILGFLFRRELLLLLQVPDEIFSLTLDLWTLMLLIIPFNFLAAATAGVFRSRKMVRLPLVTGLIVCLLNTAGDLGLGLGWFGLPALGGRGLVIASIISVAIGACFNLFMLRRFGLFSLKIFSSWRWEKRALPYLLRVAIPSGANAVFWQLGYMVLYIITATLPSNRVAAIAGLTAGMSVEAILFLPAWAFSMTGSILVGHCLGAGDRAEARRVGLRIVGSGALCMSVAGLILLPFVQEVTAFVAPDPAVQTVAISYIIYNIIAVPFTVTGMILSGIFSGAGATIYPLLTFTVSTWAVRLPLAWIMGHLVWKEASGVFLAMLVSQVVQAAVSFYLFLRKDWYRFAGTVRRSKQENI